MLKTNIKSAIRSFLKFKVFSTINLLGFALGMVSVMVLVTYISFELSFDRFHTHRDSIYRVNEISTNPDYQSTTPMLRVVAGPELKVNFPEIADFNRIRTFSKNITREDITVQARRVLYVDTNFFSFFTFPLQKGNLNTPFPDKHSIVLTREKADIIFGETDPIGNTIELDGEFYTVTAIADVPPRNSHIQFDAVVPLKILLENPDHYIGWDGGLSTFTFVKLHENTTQEMVEAKLPDFLWERVNEKDNGSGFFTEYYLESLTQIHLFSDVDWDHFGKTDFRYVLTMLGIAIIILLLACANYILITSGIMTLRLKEFNIKKHLGAGKNFLRRQVTVETGLSVFISFCLSVILIYLFRIQVQKLTGYEFDIVNVHFPSMIGYFVLLSMFLVFIISEILHGQYTRKIKGITSGERKVAMNRRASLSLVAGFQFLISIVLITSIFVVYKQQRYALNKDLGFNRENVMFVISSSIPAKKDVLIDEFKKINGVENISASFGLPGLESTRNGYRPEGQDEWRMFNALFVDDEFFETYNLQLADGRSFRKGKEADADSYIINQTLARQLNWDKPVGKSLFRDGRHEIIGVVRDFHLASIYEKIPPLIISKAHSEEFYALSLKISTDNIQHTIVGLKKSWESIVPNEVFSFAFLDEKYQNLYAEVKRLGTILLIFTVLAITISLLGLFGITLLTINSYTKEIGIRKVNGAKSKQIILMLNQDFLKWVLIAFVIGCPIAWYGMNRWLENFAYKTQLSWWIFVLAGAIAVVIALVTVSWQSWRAASRNPVEALRYE